MANEEKLFQICASCQGSGEVPVPDGMYGGTTLVGCPRCGGDKSVEWGKLDGLLGVIGVCADILDKCIDIKERVDEIKEIVEGG